MIKKGKPIDLKSLLPSPENINAIATTVDFSHLDKVAIRRSKVRELMQMGYNAHQISIVLRNGIRVGPKEEEKIIEVASSDDTVLRDIQYIKTELLANDDDMMVKRRELLDKLGFLYNQAVANYALSKGAVKNSFLNTALNVLNKVMEVEGVRSPDNLNVNLNADAKIAQFSADISKLDENDKSLILGAIRKIREQRFDKGLRGDGVPDSTSTVRTPSSKDEGVPRKS